MKEHPEQARRLLGEILVAEGWVAAADVRQALADQVPLGVRLASLLIRRGLLEPDQAAQALGKLHGVPPALARHLEARDPEAAQWLSAQDAHGYQALPLGLARDHSMVVCVRDPNLPNLVDDLQQAVQRRVTLAVSSAAVLSPLLRQVYGPAPDAFEVDVSFSATEEADPDPFASGSFQLAQLDDEAVQRDPSQQLMLPRRDSRSWAIVSPPSPSVVEPAPPPRAASTPPHAMPAGIMPTRRGTSTSPPLATATVLPGTMPTRRSMSTPRSTPTVAPPRPAPEFTRRPASTPPAPAPAIRRSSITPAVSSPPLAGASSRTKPSSHPTVHPTLPRLPALPPLGRSGPVATPRDPPSPSSPPHPRSAARAEIDAAWDLLSAGASATQEAAGLAALRGLPDDASRDHVISTALDALRARWSAVILFAVNEGNALGQQGFGPRLTPAIIEALVIPLHSGSVLRSAWEGHRVVDSCTSSPVQERLLRVLGAERAHAAPILVANNVVGVLAASARGIAAPQQLAEVVGELGERFARLLRVAERGGTDPPASR